MKECFWGKVGVLRPALVISVSLNLFLAAFMATHYASRGGHGFGGVPPRQLMTRIAKDLPSGDAAILWEAYEAHEDKLNAVHAEFLATVANASAVLSEPRVDEPRFREAVILSRDKRGLLGEAIVEVVLEAFPKMSHESRQWLLRKSVR